MLREVGLRPTRQRLALGWLLFQKGDRHITAEILHDEASRARVPVSLATVYNTLHQFTEVGLLREFAVDGSKTYFDTNVHEHHHYFVEGDNQVLDIPGEIGMAGMPEAPRAMRSPASTSSSACARNRPGTTRIAVAVPPRTGSRAAIAHACRASEARRPAAVRMQGARSVPPNGVARRARYL